MGELTRRARLLALTFGACAAVAVLPATASAHGKGDHHGKGHHITISGSLRLSFESPMDLDDLAEALNADDWARMLDLDDAFKMALPGMSEGRGDAPALDLTLGQEKCPLRPLLSTDSDSILKCGTDELPLVGRDQPLFPIIKAFDDTGIIS